MRVLFVVFALLPSASGCSLALDLDQFLGADAGGQNDDAGQSDAGPSDAGPSDAGGDEDAATPRDAGPRDAGMEPCFGSGTRCPAQMAAGANFTCARFTDGEVVCWGSNLHRQLGLDIQGTSAPSVPDAPVAGLSDAIDLSAAYLRACAVREEGGQVVCWGENASGPGGNEHVPVPVEGIRNAVQVSVGKTHACALLRDGTVWCWGDNSKGQRGGGDSADWLPPNRVRLPSPADNGRVSGRTSTDGGPMPVPVEVVEIDDAVDISAGTSHTCAVLDRDGRVACWGANDNGQLGVDPETSLQPVPVTVAGLFQVAEVRVGDEHTCARDEDGSVACWGKNSDGQLGNDSYDDSSLPQVTGLTGAASLATGSRHNCVVVESGGRCWGANYDGQLGNGDPLVTTSAAPIEVIGL